MQAIFRAWSIILLLIASSTLYAAQVSPAGYWKTIDDVTGRPRAIIKIDERGGTLVGRIVKTFPSPGDTGFCRNCTGSRRNQPIVGLVIMHGLKNNPQDPTQWAGGEILDPKTGKTYHCNLQVKDGGSRLLVRGYLGMPLLGRTQTWTRVR